MEELGDSVCLATDFGPSDGEVTLNTRDGRVHKNTSSAAVSPRDKTWFYAGFTNETLYSCELHGASANNHQLEMCAELHPDKSKLNTVLLLMNGVRVILTKAVAFSTVFTIRAILL